MPKDILGRPVLTAADLDAMTPAQRKAAFETSIVTDLDQLPKEYLAELRAAAQDLAARRDSAQRDIPHAS